MKIFLDATDFDLWDYIQNGPIVRTIFINNEVVYQLIKLWTAKEKEKETKF